MKYCLAAITACEKMDLSIKNRMPFSSEVRISRRMQLRKSEIAHIFVKCIKMRSSVARFSTCVLFFYLYHLFF